MTGRRVAARGLSPDEVRRLYTDKIDLYHWFFVRLLGYGRGMRALLAGSDCVRAGQRILDAGCGSGVVTRGALAVIRARGLAATTIDGFDLTPAMLERFGEWLARNGVQGVTLRLADVLDPSTLPGSWTSYDLVLSSAMLEYLPKASLATALRHLRSRLAPGGRLVFVITKRNWLMDLLIERWWRANAYGREELEAIVRAAGFAEIELLRFPLRYRWLDLWGWVVSARTPPSHG